MIQSQNGVYNSLWSSQDEEYLPENEKLIRLMYRWGAYKLTVR